MLKLLARGSVPHSPADETSMRGSGVAFARFFAYPQYMELLTSDEIVLLSPPERLDLIGQLWDSLEQHQLPLSQAQEAELERRLVSLDQDRRQGVTWAALKAELEQRCP